MKITLENIKKIETYLKEYGVTNPNYLAGVYELENKIEKFNYLSKELREKLAYKNKIDIKLSPILPKKLSFIFLTISGL